MPSGGIRECDFGERTVLHPIVERGSRPRAFGTVAAIEVVDEVGEHSASLEWIGDDRSNRWKIRNDAVLEMKEEMWIVLQVA